MSRIPIVADSDDALDEVRPVFAGARELLAFVSNATRTFAQVPELAKWVIPMIASIQRGGSDAKLDPRIKELAIIRTSTMNECFF